jgi:hypothetical protein
MGKQGIIALEENRVVEGESPLAPFSAHTASFLRRLAGYANAGDVIVNGAYDQASGYVVGIDALVGAHGGVGGMQTRPFLIFPSAWTERDPELVGATAVHRFLRRHTLGEEPGESLA